MDKCECPHDYSAGSCIEVTGKPQDMICAKCRKHIIIPHKEDKMKFKEGDVVLVETIGTIEVALEGNGESMYRIKLSNGTIITVPECALCSAPVPNDFEGGNDDTRTNK